MPQQLSPAMKDLLVEHIDRDVPIFKNNFRRWRYQLALVNRKLLRFDRTLNPTMTILTEGGREQLCKTLAEYADVIVRAAEAGAFDWRQAMQVHALLAATFGARGDDPPEIAVLAE